MAKVDVFIICPVRNADPSVTKKISNYVSSLERQGKKVHWPARDTNQVDPIGLRIMEDNRAGMLRASEVHIWWDPKSEGSKADIGALMMLLFFKTKRVAIINKDEVKPTPNKSFENLILELERRSRD